MINVSQFRNRHCLTARPDELSLSGHLTRRLGIVITRRIIKCLATDGYGSDAQLRKYLFCAASRDHHGGNDHEQGNKCC